MKTYDPALNGLFILDPQIHKRQKWLSNSGNYLRFLQSVTAFVMQIEWSSSWRVVGVWLSSPPPHSSCLPEQ